MVKNIVGGCKSKRNARKFAVEENVKSSRISLNEYELYAIVTKMYGNGRCLVKTDSNTELQCVIRNKFKGKFKRNNVISIGTYLLVGLREWEKMSGYKTCDVLEVYSSQDIGMLSKVADFQRLVSYTSTETAVDDIFDNSATAATTEEVDETLMVGKLASRATAETEYEMGNNGEINVDDI